MSHTRYEPRVTRVQRSELAVPGSNPGMFEKAASSNADYVFLDLEDAVAPDDKEQARRNVIEALNDIDWRGRGKTVSVRINGIDTHYMYRDVVDVIEQAGHKIDTILIPKAGVSSDVYMVDAMVSQIELAKNIEHSIGLEALIENRSRHGQCRKHRHRQCAYGGVAFRGSRLRGQLSGEDRQHRRAQPRLSG